MGRLRAGRFHRDINVLFFRVSSATQSQEHVLLEDGGEGSLQTPKMRESSEAGETESQKRRRRGEEERGWGGGGGGVETESI